MPERPINERRQHTRVARQLPVRFGTEHRMFDGIVSDISEGGLRIQSTETFPVKAILNVFIGFPGGKIHLRARVVRSGGEPPTIALALLQDNPAFSRAYEQWIAEVRQTAHNVTATNADPSKAVSRNAPTAATPPGEKGKGRIQRHLETSRGNAYDVVIEPEGGAWTLSIFLSPRNPNIARPEFTRAFPDYDSADRALREFLRER